jgi:hypothetical protein
MRAELRQYNVRHGLFFANRVRHGLVMFQNHMGGPRPVLSVCLTDMQQCMHVLLCGVVDLAAANTSLSFAAQLGSIGRGSSSSSPFFSRAPLP